MKIIDLNEVYQNRLDKENKFCRYSEVRTYKDNKVEINSDNGYINASWIHIPYHKSFIAKNIISLHLIEPANIKSIVK